jgi:DNA-binding NtrC family response regulator
MEPLSYCGVKARMSDIATGPIPPVVEQSASEHIPRALVVLVVEDEVLVRFALADHLRERGLKVHEASGGREAIQLLHKAEIDVVFTDVYMPGSVDGFDLTQWIEENRPGMPVIIASGAVDCAQAESEAGGRFFSKPYDFNLVAAAIEAAANARGREPREAADRI